MNDEEGCKEARRQGGKDFSALMEGLGRAESSLQKIIGEGER